MFRRPTRGPAGDAFSAVFWCLAMLGASLPASALEPARALTQYRLDVWQIEDGLPMNSIRDVVQTRDGFLWLATFEGLTRFDGHRFEILDASAAPEVRVFVTTVFEDRQGALWIGAQGGLGRLRDGELAGFTTADGLVHNAVQALAEDPEGNLWIGTQAGVSRFRDGRFDSFTTADGLAHDDVREIVAAGDGSVWAATAAGLSRYVDGHWTRLSTADGLIDDDVVALAEDGQGSLWIGTRDRGLQRLAGDRWTHFSTADGLLSDAVRTLYVDRRGSLWLGTQDHGLSRFHDGEWSHLTSAEGLTDDSVRGFYEDLEGSLWIATWSAGLICLKDGEIMPFGRPEGLADDRALPILEDRHGDIWIGTRRGLSRLRDGRFTTYATADGLAHASVRSLAEDRQGNLWIGTQGGGLQRLRNGRFETYSTARGLSHDDVRAILEDRDGGLWIATWGGGLNLLRDGRISVYRAADGLAHDFAMALHQDRQGDLWIGTSDGLSRLADGRFTTYTTGDGLGSNVIVALYEDRDGSLWIGTIGGLTRFRDGMFTNFTTADGLFDDRVFQILEDADGDFWMSSNRGISRVAKAELEELAAGRVDRVGSIAYGTADGMRSRECNGGFRPAGWQSRDGRLWFPTIRGVAMIDPSRPALNQVPPPVVIERLVAGTEEIRPRGDAAIELGVRDFEIRYAGLSLRNPDRVAFRYRLEGFDHGWVEAGSRRQAFYTNVPPGPYRFRVTAANDDGVWNETGAAVELYLRPAFYETWLFYLICALGLAFAGRAAYRLRVRHLHRRYDELFGLKQELEARQSEIAAKQSEIETKNDELAAKNEELEHFAYTVSHDLKSPLITIHGFMRLAEKDALAGDVERLRDDFRRIRGASAKMEELLDDLLELSRIGRVTHRAEDVPLGELVAEALELVAGPIAERGVRVAVAGGDLPTVHGDRSRLRQIFQNLIENAVKYMGPQPAPEIEIGATVKNGAAECRVRDNGTGIDPRYHDQIFGLFRKLAAESDGTGIGLALVTRIVELHGGRVWVESQGEGHGSTFFVTLPLAGAAPL